jgi:NitT/TauT family transport system substrate-binding protein
MRRLIPASLAALALMALPALAQPLDAPRPLAQPTTVKIVVGGFTEINAAALLARDLGEFAKENITAEISMQKPADGLVLLATGRVDVLASQPGAAFFNAVAGGVDARMVAPAGFSSPDSKTGFWVSRAWLAGRPYAPAMLKGQSIGSAVGVGTTVSYWLEVELEKAGLDQRAVTWRTMGVGDIPVALENGAINVGFLFDGIWQKADEQKVQFAFGGTPDISGAYFYGPNLLRKDRAVGDAVMRAMTRTVRTYLQGHFHQDAKVAPVLAKALGISLDDLRRGGEMMFPPEMPMARYTAAVLQKTYGMTQGVLTYTTPLTDDQTLDRGFLAAAGIAPPAQ